jgi:hypothetical protein
MVFRSLVLGLLLAAIVLIVDRPTVTVTVPIPTVEPDDRLDVIDVSAAMSGMAMAKLVLVPPGEQITMVDDRPVDDSIEGRAQIAMHAGSTRGYIDVTIGTGAAKATNISTRRVLLLLH